MLRDPPVGAVAGKRISAPIPLMGNDPDDDAQNAQYPGQLPDGGDRAAGADVAGERCRQLGGDLLVGGHGSSRRVREGTGRVAFVRSPLSRQAVLVSRAKSSASVFAMEAAAW